MEADENKRLLADWLGREYRVTECREPENIPAGYDLCILDTSTYRSHASRLRERKHTADPEFLPVLLVGTDTDGLRNEPSLWEVVDDVVETPIRKAELSARIDNLLERRRNARRLLDRERTLAETVSELELKDLAMDAAPVGITLLDPVAEDHPILYANTAFERMTGYDREAIIGRDHRFLRGPDTDAAALESLRTAIANEEPATVTLVNYRKDGRQFWNRVEVAPVYDAGELVAFVSFRTDITDEQIREQRLTVLNRVMRHNLSNDLNVIKGFARNLRDSPQTQDRSEALEHILDSAESLGKLSETASWIEQVLNRCRGGTPPTEVTAAVGRIRERMRTAHPDVDFQVDVDGGPYHVPGDGIVEALSELIDNAARHGRSEVAISIAPHEQLPGNIVVAVADDGSGISADTVEVLRRGGETQLIHGDGLGLWLVQWVVTLVGGSIEVCTPTAGGTVVRLTLPTCDPEDR